MSSWKKFDYADQETWPENGQEIIVDFYHDALSENGFEVKAYRAEFIVFDNGGRATPGLEEDYGPLEYPMPIHRWQPMPDVKGE